MGTGKKTEEDGCMPTYKNELERFIYEKCYENIFNPLAAWVGEHPMEFTTNVSIVGDVISFDAVVSCEIELEEETYHDRQSASVNQWFRVSCSVTVEDKLKDSRFALLNPIQNCVRQHGTARRTVISCR